ncbi:MAG: Uma2 family endonuclease [Candidatus Omnitrophota bacterium]|jgi:Uma2 family endonuclease|nr:MAG: Uma2 family endonuclease [Candidatus Omnitrophota bacterium]
MDWLSVCEDKSLQDLPYKIELNEWGNIVMTPASNRHARLQVEIALLIQSFMKHGAILSESSVSTAKGVKVADVAWGSYEFFIRNGEETPYLEAPDLCVEVRSPSNSFAEMMEKKDLYFSKGAKEFWLCDEDGNMSFYNCRGEREQSAIFPEMVKKVDLEIKGM